MKIKDSKTFIEFIEVIAAIVTYTESNMAPAHHARDAPQQYTQTSRKGKKAWRKNVDVSDVQAGLDVAREEIIQG